MRLSEQLWKVRSAKCALDSSEISVALKIVKQLT